MRYCEAARAGNMAGLCVVAMKLRAWLTTVRSPRHLPGITPSDRDPSSRGADGTGVQRRSTQLTRSQQTRRTTRYPASTVEELFEVIACDVIHSQETRPAADMRRKASPRWPRCSYAVRSKLRQVKETRHAGLHQFIRRFQVSSESLIRPALTASRRRGPRAGRAQLVRGQALSAKAPRCPQGYSLPAQ